MRGGSGGEGAGAREKMNEEVDYRARFARLDSK